MFISGMMGVVTQPPSVAKRGWRSAASRWPYVLTAFLAAVLSMAGTLMIDREHRWGIGLWLSDFAKSPGLAGVCALVGASIAFIGISRQVRVSRESVEQAREIAAEAQTSAQRTLDHQQATEQDRAWWNSFEWATSRAIPADQSSEPLPFVAVLNTFQALADSATDDVQRAAIAGVMDVAAKRSGTPSADASADGSEASARNEDQLRSALLSFVTSTANTPARSQEAEYKLYELSVMAALRALEPRGVDLLGTWQTLVPNQGFRPDAVLMINGRRVIVEIKFWNRQRSGGNAIEVVRRTVQRMRGSSVREPVLIIAPIAPKIPAGAVADLAVKVTSWNSSSDDDSLFEALVEAANLREWEPN